MLSIKSNSQVDFYYKRLYNINSYFIKLFFVYVRTFKIKKGVDDRMNEDNDSYKRLCWFLAIATYTAFAILIYSLSK